MTPDTPDGPEPQTDHEWLMVLARDVAAIKRRLDSTALVTRRQMTLAVAIVVFAILTGVVVVDWQRVPTVVRDAHALVP